MPRKETDKRITATVDLETYEKLAAIAAKRNISVSRLLRNIIDSSIQNDGSIGATQFEMIMIRLNQVTDALTQLGSNVNNLQKTSLDAITSLIKLTKGDNYLFDEEDDQA